jgi:para-nitrobenzyl esterase
MLISGLAALMILSSAPVTSADAAPSAEVSVSQGRLAGHVSEGVARWLNIPYAAPPVGELRWRPPQPAAGWTGVRDATVRGPICMQPPANGDNGVGPLPMSEDCLQLNVFAPTDATGPAPVMVWIHGGGYVNGSATADLYDGAALARQGVVVVTVNYRLGRLGFFDHPALAAARPDGEPAGNYGVMDMIAALEWVRDNIGAFGGDPGQVTIFGESAGGMAVLQLMTSPAAEGLFHRAAVQSGPPRLPARRLDRPGPRGEPSVQDASIAWMAERGLEAADAAALRALPAESLLLPWPSFRQGVLNIVDGQIVPEPVMDVFSTGRQAKVPLIVGANSSEFFWVTADNPVDGVLDDDIPETDRPALVEAYGGVDVYRAHVISDILFVEPARQIARLHARTGAPTWLYRFDVVSAAAPQEAGGAGHAWDRQYVFHTLNASPWPTDAMDVRAADLISGYWAAFGREGDPNGPGRPAWPQVGEALRVMQFSNDGPRVVEDPLGSRLELLARWQDAR